MNASPLVTALGLAPGGCIALVGAGGKTTLGYRLMREFAAAGSRAVFTTTGSLWQPAPGTADVLIDQPGGDSAAIAQRLASDDWRSAIIVTSVQGAVSNAALDGAYLPAIQTKRGGLTPQAICALRDGRSAWVIEADAARGLRIKAPGPTEPLIPPCADVVCVLASLDALGRPLDDRIAHRADRVAALTRTMPGSVITPPLLLALLTHPDGGLKAIPAGARKVAVLTQHDASALHPDAADLVPALRAAGYDSVVVVAPRAKSPVLAI